jgi:hypothetical protein
MIRSESTSALGQPSDTNETDGAAPPDFSFKVTGEGMFTPQQ